MFVAVSYFPHLRQAEEVRLARELEWRRVAEEREPQHEHAWRAQLRRLLVGPRRRVEQCCATLPQVAAGPADCCAG